MVGIRDLTFVALVLGGTAFLGWNLWPDRPRVKAAEVRTGMARQDALAETVSAVDRQFVDLWADNGVTPAETASDLQIARRLSLGLMGTIPSLEEIREFESLPPDQRIPWWIEHILADPRSHDYLGERMARAFVGTEDGPFLIYRRRRLVHWIAEQLAAQRPYDHIVRSLLADEGLWTGKPSVNFISVTVHPDNKNQPDPVRLAGRTARGFLGLRIDCAQCHNHPFVSWKQSDFEGLSAFFAQTQVGFRGIENKKDGEYEVEDRKTQQKRIVPPAVPFSPELVPTEGTRRDRLAAWVTDPRNPYFAKAFANRMWALVVGQPLVEPVDDLQPESPDPVRMAVLQILADDFAAHHFDIRRLVRIIASTRVFRLDSKTDRDPGATGEKTWAVFPMSRLRPEQVAGSILQSSQISAINGESHILIRLTRFGQENEFVKRYGDAGEDEFEGRGGTIPQRLLILNGKLSRERIDGNPFNASARIAMLTNDDSVAIEAAYLSALSRRPTPAETAHFLAHMKKAPLSRADKIADIFWALLNATEFSWNH